MKGPRRAKYRLSPNEEARLLKEETNKRRKLRLIQVREQAKINAAETRQAVKNEYEKQLQKLAYKITDEFEQEKDEKLRKMERVQRCSIKDIGNAHVSADQENEENKLGARITKMREDAVMAEERGRQALQLLQEENQRKHILQNQHIFSRNTALEVEKLRAAEIAAKAPPEPDPIKQIDSKKNNISVRCTDVDAFSLTHFHLMEEIAVDKAHVDEQGDAMADAKVESENIKAMEEDKKRSDNERKEKARLRHKHAHEKELLRLNYNGLLNDLSDLQRKDMNRRQKVVANLPKQIFLPPSRRIEEKQDTQVNMERAFEEMYMVGTDYMGDLSLALDPHPPPDAPTVTTDLDLSNTGLDDQEQDETANTSEKHSTQPVPALKDITNVKQTIKPDKGKMDISLKRLLNRIKSQREKLEESTGVESSRSKVPCASAEATLTQYTMSSGTEETQSCTGSISTGTVQSGTSEGTLVERSHMMDTISDVEDETSQDQTEETENITSQLNDKRVAFDDQKTLLHPAEHAAKIRGSAITYDERTGHNLDFERERQEKARRENERIRQETIRQQEKLEQQKKELEQRLNEINNRCQQIEKDHGPPSPPKHQLPPNATIPGMQPFMPTMTRSRPLTDPTLQAFTKYSHTAPTLRPSVDVQTSAPISKTRKEAPTRDTIQQYQQRLLQRKKDSHEQVKEARLELERKARDLLSSAMFDYTNTAQLGPFHDVEITTNPSPSVIGSEDRRLSSLTNQSGGLPVPSMGRLSPTLPSSYGQSSQLEGMQYTDSRDGKYQQYPPSRESSLLKSPAQEFNRPIPATEATRIPSPLTDTGYQTTTLTHSTQPVPSIPTSFAHDGYNSLTQSFDQKQQDLSLQLEEIRRQKQEILERQRQQEEELGKLRAKWKDEIRQDPHVLTSIGMSTNDPYQLEEEAPFGRYSMNEDTEDKSARLSTENSEFLQTTCMGDDEQMEYGLPSSLGTDNDVRNFSPRHLSTIFEIDTPKTDKTPRQSDETSYGNRLSARHSFIEQDSLEKSQDFSELVDDGIKGLNTEQVRSFDNAGISESCRELLEKVDTRLREAEQFEQNYGDSAAYQPETISFQNTSGASKTSSKPGRTWQEELSEYSIHSDAKTNDRGSLGSKDGTKGERESLLDLFRVREFGTLNPVRDSWLPDTPPKNDQHSEPSNIQNDGSLDVTADDNTPTRRPPTKRMSSTPSEIKTTQQETDNFLALQPEGESPQDNTSRLSDYELRLRALGEKSTEGADLSQYTIASQSTLYRSNIKGASPQIDEQANVSATDGKFADDLKSDMESITDRLKQFTTMLSTMNSQSPMAEGIDSTIAHLRTQTTSSGSQKPLSVVSLQEPGAQQAFSIVKLQNNQTPTVQFRIKTTKSESQQPFSLLPLEEDTTPENQETGILEEPNLSLVSLSSTLNQEPLEEHPNSSSILSFEQHEKSLLSTMSNSPAYVRHTAPTEFTQLSPDSVSTLPDTSENKGHVGS